MKNKLAVVILNWNGKKFLEKFIPGVVKHSSLADVRIIVADNNSSDDSVKWLKNNYKGKVEILEFDENLGFAGGYNRVFELVDSEYIGLLNSDVEIKSNWLQPVLDYMKNNPGYAAICSKLRDQKQPEKFEYASAAGGYIDKYGYPFCKGRIFESIEKDTGQYDEISEVLWGAGAALFVKRDIWNKLGGLDEDFFAHMEEIDLCWRIINSGNKIVCIPDSVVYHVGGGTLPKNNPRKTFLNFRNNIWMLQKNLPDNKKNKIIFIRFWLDIIALIVFALKLRFKDAGAVIRAWNNILKTRKETLNKRKTNIIKDHTFKNKVFYKRSILWQYYFKNRKKFSDLQDTN